MTRGRAGMLVTCLALLAPAALPSAASAVAVRHGAHYGSRIFPDNAFTVRDSRQVTGRRVNFRKGLDYPTVKGRVRPGCDRTDYSICDAFAELNKLDGFDLQPRVVVPFTGTIRLGSVSASNFFITSNAGKFVSGFRQLTFDPVTHTLAGISDRFLREDTRYRVHVTSGIRGKRGKRVKACAGACVVPFTTRTASGELVRIRRSMDLPISDPKNAYLLAGFPGASSSTASRRLTFTQNGKDDVFLAASVAPSLVDPLNGMIRNDQVKADARARGRLRPGLHAQRLRPLRQRRLQRLARDPHDRHGSCRPRLRPREHHDGDEQRRRDDVPQLRPRTGPRRRRQDRRRPQRRRRPDRP